MARINELGLTNEQVGQQIDYASIPDQFGSFQEPPQPGSYRFRFPKRMDAIWEKFDHTGGNPPGQRIRARFDSSFPLTIVQSPGGQYDNLPFETQVSNAERQRGRKGDDTAPWVSDMDYFFRDVWGLPGKPAGGNVGYAQEFMKHADSEFGGDIEWSWNCNQNRSIYVPNGSGGYTEVKDRMGCGTKYYQKDVEQVPSNPEDPASPKVFPLRVECQCGAHIRAFANIARVRA